MPKFSNEEYARATIANADREELQEAQEEVEQLESQLTEARAEIERLGDVVSMYTDILIAKDTRIAELEADVVFSLKNGLYLGNQSGAVLADPGGEGNGATDADILRAVREARNGVS